MKKAMFKLVYLLLMALIVACHNAGAEPGTVILQDGSYFNGHNFVPFREMVIKNGTITAISDLNSSEIGERISVVGKYVIPGLIDAHVHVSGCPAFPYVMAEASDNLKSTLHCGVTTVIDLFYAEAGVKELRDKVSGMPASYSSILFSGPILTAPGGHGTEYGVPTRTMTTVAEAHTITNEVIDNGMDVVKVVYQAYTNPHTIDKDMLKEIVKVAHGRGKKVFVHIDDAAEAMDCVDAGVDVLAHIPADRMTDGQLIKLKKSGIVVIPTITVLQSVAEGHDAGYMSDSLLWRTANPVYMDGFSRMALPRVPMPDSVFHRYFHNVGYRENLANCVKMNIPIVAGTDAGNYAVFYGYSLYNEIAQYVAAGMTNARALCTATENIAYIFPGIKTGKVQEGYDADLVVLGADPLNNIGNMKDIKMVIHKGEIVDMAPPFASAAPAATANALVFDPSVLKIETMKDLPDYVVEYTDNVINGKSEFKMALQKDATGNNYLHLAGKVVKQGYTGFAGACFLLGKKKDHNPPAVDLCKYKGISFDVKGNGEKYYVMVLSSAVKDYNYHTAPFDTHTGWHTVTIPFANLDQNHYYGKQVKLDPKTIQGFVFEAVGKDYNIDVDIRNIRLVE